MSIVHEALAAGAPRGVGYAGNRESVHHAENACWSRTTRAFGDCGDGRHGVHRRGCTQTLKRTPSKRRAIPAKRDRRPGSRVLQRVLDLSAGELTFRCDADPTVREPAGAQSAPQPVKEAMRPFIGRSRRLPSTGAWSRNVARQRRSVR